MMAVRMLRFVLSALLVSLGACSLLLDSEPPAFTDSPTSASKGDASARPSEGDQAPATEPKGGEDEKAASKPAGSSMDAADSAEEATEASNADGASAPEPQAAAPDAGDGDSGDDAKTESGPSPDLPSADAVELGDGDAEELDAMVPDQPSPAAELCPSGLVCSDGSCPRLRWTFEDPEDLAYLEVSPSGAALSIEDTDTAGEGNKALRIELKLPATAADGTLITAGRLLFRICPKTGERHHTVNLSGRRPWYNYRFEGEAFPPGAQGVLSQHDGTNSRSMAAFDSMRLIRNQWLFADPVEYVADYDANLGPDVSSVMVSLTLQRDESWEGTIWIDNLEVDRIGDLNGTPSPPP